MDLLIEKSNQSFKLSEIGMRVINIDDSSTSLDIDSRTVKGRSGNIFASARYGVKKIKVTGRLTVSSIKDFMSKKDEVNGLLIDSEPFYITKMYPKNDKLYGFELPGVQSGDLDLIGQEHVKWHYRWKVNISGLVEYSFIGKSFEGLKYDFSMSFLTSDMPFGETIKKDLAVTGKEINYLGTAPFSQLEYPWVLKLVSNGGQSAFFVEIDGRKWTFKQASPLVSGDQIKVSGIATTLNGTNVTAKTNYEYFVIKPKFNKLVPINTDFKGTISIIDFREVYL